MFWRFGTYHNPSNIDTIIDKGDFQLEDILDESGLIEEIKQHNGKLMEYLRDPKVLEKLLDYVVAPKLEPVAAPEDNEDDDESRGKGISLPFTRPRALSQATDIDDGAGEKKRNRYAFLAAEILSSDNYSIIEALIESRGLLGNFWQFLKRPTPLDPLQASYFTKVNESLFDKKTEEMLDLLKSLDNAVPDMLKHVDCPMIMDLLLRIISLERTEAGQGIVEVRYFSSIETAAWTNNGTLQWLYTQNVMPTLLSFLGPEHSWSTQTSAGDFMKAIITVSANASQNEQTCIGPNELTRQLVSKPCVEQLIQYMLGGGNPLTCGVGIVIEVIRKNNSDYDPDAAEPNAAPSCRDPIYLGTLLRLFAQHIPDFMNLIMNAPANKDKLNSTFGERIEPLGFDRFKTCELMAELLHCSNMGLLNEVGSEELIAARDTQRQALRAQGKLLPMRVDEAPSSTDDLTMRMSQSSPVEEIRRLEVTNSSADDDGFEEVTHNGDEDSSHGVEELPEVSVQGSGSSILDKDEDDFVDEPLSSPRLNFREVDDPNPAQPQQIAGQLPVVLPLLPTEKAAEAPVDPVPLKSSQAGDSDVPVSGAVSQDILSEQQSSGAQKDRSVADKQPESAPSDDNVLPVLDTSVSQTEPLKLTEPADKIAAVKPASPETMSPHPEDTPAPLFSRTSTSGPGPSTISEEATSVSSPPPTSAAEPRAQGNSESSTTPLPEAEEVSIIVQHVSAPTTPIEDDSPTGPQLVVGDYLKKQFVDHRVVPTILGFFFTYPWNNFLHNVVYDIVQQVFNGPMERGYNPTLAISLFESADITNLIINGQLASEKSQAQSKTRMGYMGHLTLIAEEVVKFTERHPAEVLGEVVMEKVMAQDWINYVEGALAETRERDNAVLGGVRPEVAMNNRAGASGLAGVGLSGLGSLGIGGGGGSSALAEAGLNGGQDLSDNSGGNGIGPFAISAGTLMSGFGSSSDEDEDEEQDNEEDVNNEVGYFPYVFSSHHISGLSQSPSGSSVVMAESLSYDDDGTSEPDYTPDSYMDSMDDTVVGEDAMGLPGIDYPYEVFEGVSLVQTEVPGYRNQVRQDITSDGQHTSSPSIHSNHGSGNTIDSDSGACEYVDDHHMDQWDSSDFDEEDDEEDPSKFLLELDRLPA